MFQSLPLGDHSVYHQCLSHFNTFVCNFFVSFKFSAEPFQAVQRVACTCLYFCSHWSQN